MKNERGNWTLTRVGVLLSITIQLILPQVAGAQQWHSTNSVPVFLGDDAQDRAATEMSSSAQCLHNLQALGNALRMYAGEHNDQFPPDWQTCQPYISSPSLLECPKSPYANAGTNWSGFNYLHASYTLLAAKPTEPTKQLIVCNFHGNYALADGSSHYHKAYARFPLAPKGKLRLASTALHLGYKSAQIVGCINNLVQIDTACRVYAGDYGDRYPTNFQALESYLASPKVLFCPIDEAADIPTNFTQVDYSKLDYTMAQASPLGDPSARFITCRLHGNFSQADGTVIRGTNALAYPGILVGQPLSQTVVPGTTAALKVLTAPGLQGVTYQWRRQQPFDAAGEPITNTVPLLGETNSSIQFPWFMMVQAGYYDVVVSLPSGLKETSDMAYLAAGFLDIFPADLDSQICRDNLKQIAFAATILSNDQPFPPATANYALGLGWPMTLFCPSDPVRRAPENWDSFSIATSSYDIKENVVPGTTNVLAVCKVHHYYVQADGVVATPDTLRLGEIDLSGQKRTLNWTGGIAPYQLEMATNLNAPKWNVVTNGIMTQQIELPDTERAAFFRVVWQSP